MNEIGKNGAIPKSADIDPSAKIGADVVLTGDGIKVCANARLDAACVIGEGVTVGEGVLVRAGAVVLHSVPPNAIVEGNPAQIVGYTSGSDATQGPELRHVNAEVFDDQSPPTNIPLNVSGSALYLMRQFNDLRGGLTMGDIPNDLPFVPARYFAVFDVPAPAIRGMHAHRKCDEFLICLNGSCHVLLDDGTNRCEVTLERPNVGVLVPAMVWRAQYRYSAGAVLLVFASRIYEDHDYLRTYDEFLAELERTRK